MKKLCNFAEVSISGYYIWLSASDVRQKRLSYEFNDFLLIKEIFDEKEETSGFRTIVMELLYRHGLIMNPKKVIRIMNKYGLICKIRRVKRYGNTFEEKRIENTFDNRLNTIFDSKIPAEIFHTDITYIKYAHGTKTAYLSLCSMAVYLVRFCEML
nr:IS3 family transposase [uncultured Anaerosporobacter sp.]